MFVTIAAATGTLPFFCYAEFIKQRATLSAVCGCLWHKTMLIADILSNMSNIIKYEESMTFLFQK